MYEALNERRNAAGLPDYQGSGRLHSKEFQQQRWIHGVLLPDSSCDTARVTVVIDRWEAEPTMMSLVKDGTITTRFVPLTWEIC